jgi:hypothetical protein
VSHTRKREGFCAVLGYLVWGSRAAN